MKNRNKMLLVILVFYFVGMSIAVPTSEPSNIEESGSELSLIDLFKSKILNLSFNNCNFELTIKLDLIFKLFLKIGSIFPHSWRRN